MTTKAEETKLAACWACGEQSLPGISCRHCAAPPWWENRGSQRGVYIIESACGLVKIGHSDTNVSWRSRVVRQQAASRTGDPAMIVAILRGASRNVERWLHTIFRDVRDVQAARDAGLPCPTEWFWPTPTLRRLTAETEFLREGERWEDVVTHG